MNPSKSTLRKYSGLLVAFFRASAMADLEYRLNIVMKVFTDIIWYVAQLSVFEVLFKHTNSISGWTLESMRVFMSVLFLVDAFWMLIFQENLDRFSDKVRRGDLDMVLAKPVNAQFMMSVQKMSTPYLVNVVLTFAWMIYSLTELPGGFEAARLLTLLISVPCGLAIAYGLRFVFSATALIFARAENIVYVWYQLYRLAMRPDTVYPPWLRYLVLTLLPVGFIASVPTQLILGLQTLSFLALAILVAAIVLWLSTLYWRFAMRFYSSASS
ncbi:MAG: ABC-2 family transporter protein [Bdellovibrionota bacterium]